MTINYRAIVAFISTLDRSLPISIHMYNAELDKFLYNWSEDTLEALKLAIENMYAYAEMKA